MSFPSFSLLAEFYEPKLRYFASMVTESESLLIRCSAKVARKCRKLAGKER